MTSKANLAIAKMLTAPDKWLDFMARRIKPVGACLEYGVIDKQGYGRIHSARLGAAKRAKAHRAVFALIWRRNPIGEVIRHSCDNRRCVNPAHLESGSQLDNIRDRNERHPRFLTAAQTDEVQRLTEQGKGAKAVADGLGVSYGAVKAWRRKNGYAKPKPRKDTPANIARAKALYAQGYSYAVIGRALGVAPNTARRWVRIAHGAQGRVTDIDGQRKEQDDA